MQVEAGFPSCNTKPFTVYEFFFFQMYEKIFTMLVQALLLIFCMILPCSLAATVTPPTDFSANITIKQGSQTTHGWMVYNFAGRRSYSFINEFSQSTYNFQEFQTATGYQYMITTSGCTCTKLSSFALQEYFLPMATAVVNSSACPGGAKGTFYVNNAFPGLYGASNRAYCFDGNTPTAEYTNDFQVAKLFSNVVVNVNPSVFPLEPLNSNIFQCSAGCI